MLYMGAAVLNPTDEEKRSGGVATIVVDLKLVVATTEESAIRQISRLIPEEHADKDNRLEVRVVPFK